MKIRAFVTTISTTLVVAALAAVWSVASPLSASCASATPLEQIANAPSESAQFVAAINQLRESKGLGDLTVDSNLTSIATSWSVTMAQSDSIFHRSNLASDVTIDWKRLGENVGEGPNVSDLMAAFIASAHHYENLVDPTFTRIGVGTARTPDGILYTAHEFAAVFGPTATPAAQSTPVTVAAAPRVTTPRVTTPRVTTPPTTTPPPPPTTTTTTEPPVTVSRSVSHNHKLNNGSSHDQQQQQNKSGGRCRAQGDANVVAAAATSLNRSA